MPRQMWAFKSIRSLLSESFCLLHIGAPVATAPLKVVAGTFHSVQFVVSGRECRWSSRSRRIFLVTFSAIFLLLLEYIVDGCAGVCAVWGCAWGLTVPYPRFSNSSSPSVSVIKFAVHRISEWCIQRRGTQKEQDSQFYSMVSDRNHREDTQRVLVVPPATEQLLICEWECEKTRIFPLDSGNTTLALHRMTRV